MNWEKLNFQNVNNINKQHEHNKHKFIDNLKLRKMQYTKESEKKIPTNYTSDLKKLRKIQYRKCEEY